jgi:O-antigen ligase
VAWIGFSPVFIFGEGDVQFTNLESGGGDFAKQCAFASLFAFVMWWEWREEGIGFLGKVPVWLAVVLLWCSASVVWAVDPVIAVRRVMLLVMVTVSISLVVQRMKSEEFLNALFIISIVILFLDWIALFVSPDGVHTAAGADPELAGDWRGAHIHKNETGAFAAIATIVFVDRAIRDRSFLICPILALLSVCLLIGTGSKTSLGLLFVAFTFGVLATTTWRYRRFRLVVCSVAIVGILMALNFYSREISDILSKLDDPGALTGRTQIWSIASSYFIDHPFFGAGYGSFWGIGKASPVFQYADGWVAEQIDHTHNGYLNIALQVGSVGLVLAVIAAVLAPATELFSAARFGRERTVLAALLFFIVLRDFLEDTIIDRSNPCWIVLVGVVSIVNRETVADAFRAMQARYRNFAVSATGNS